MGFMQYSSNFSLLGYMLKEERRLKGGGSPEGLAPL
jgi:hypothetical protein